MERVLCCMPFSLAQLTLPIDGLQPKAWLNKKVVMALKNKGKRYETF